MRYVLLYWEGELYWIIKEANGKGWRASMLRMAIAEAAYYIWHYKNSIVFGRHVDSTTIAKQIIYSLVYRGWQYRKIRKQLVKLMV